VLSIGEIVGEIENSVRTLSYHNSELLKERVISLGSKLRMKVIELMLESAKIGKKLESEI
ncbi:hypothetical protein LCG94_05855, partial [Aeromonas salmonicida]